MRKILICIFGFVLLGRGASAQEIIRIKADDLDRWLYNPDTALVVNLWATWCGPCVEEMPYFVKVAREMKGRRVKFIFISLDLGDAYPEKIRRFVKKYKIESTVLWLDEPNANRYANKIDPRWQGSIPATIFVSSGRGYRRFVEGSLGEKALRRAVEGVEVLQNKRAITKSSLEYMSEKGINLLVTDLRI